MFSLSLNDSSSARGTSHYHRPFLSCPAQESMVHALTPVLPLKQRDTSRCGTVRHRNRLMVAQMAPGLSKWFSTRRVPELGSSQPDKTISVVLTVQARCSMCSWPKQLFTFSLCRRPHELFILAIKKISFSSAPGVAGVFHATHGEICAFLKKKTLLYVDDLVSISINETFFLFLLIVTYVFLFTELFNC
jgi:hypothetical protein